LPSSPAHLREVEICQQFRKLYTCLVTRRSVRIQSRKPARIQEVKKACKNSGSKKNPERIQEVKKPARIQEVKQSCKNSGSKKACKNSGSKKSLQEFRK
jgi:hypothetical protein